MDAGTNLPACRKAILYRHSYVHQYHIVISLAALKEHPYGFLAIGCAFYRCSLTLQQIFCNLCIQIIIFCKKNSFSIQINVFRLKILLNILFFAQFQVNCKIKIGSFSLHAFNLYLSAHSLYDLVADRQSKPGPLILRHIRAHLLERREYYILEFRRNPYTGIFHRKIISCFFTGRRLLLDCQGYNSIFRRKLDRIGQKVQKYLAKPERIAFQAEVLDIHIMAECNLIFLCLVFHHFFDLIQQVSHQEVHSLDLHLPILNL